MNAEAMARMDIGRLILKELEYSLLRLDSTRKSLCVGFCNT